MASCSLLDADSDPSSSSSTSSSSPSSSSSASPSTSVRPPQASAADLVLPEDDISSGTDWKAEEGDDLEILVADHPPSEDGSSVEPASCAEAALVTKGPDGADTDFAGAVGKSTDDTGHLILAVVTEPRSVDDLRTTREKCSKITARRPDLQLTVTESVSDGPGISGADDSFVLRGTYEVDGPSKRSFTRYGVVAEVRDTLVVVMVNPDGEEDERERTSTMSDEATSEAVSVATQQVDRIAAAN